MVTVNDLAGTDVKSVNVDLDAFDGGGDGSADTVDRARHRAAPTASRFTSPDGCADGHRPRRAGARHRRRGRERQRRRRDARRQRHDHDRPGGLRPDAVYNVDGGADADVVKYNGTAGADTISVLANGTEVAHVRTPAPARLDTTAVESLVVLGLGGADTITGGNGIATLTALTLDGGDGDDDARAAATAPTCSSAARGNDLVDGNSAPTRRSSAAPATTRFQWDPGDGSDTVEGQAGNDRLRLQRLATSASSIDALRQRRRARGSPATSPRSRWTSTASSASNVRALGGADTVTVNDLAGTDVRRVDVDLTAFDGGGDGAADTVDRPRHGAAPTTSPSPRPAASRRSAASRPRSSSRAPKRRTTTSSSRRSAAPTRSRRPRASSGRPRTTSTAATAPTSSRYSGTSVGDTIQVLPNGGEVSTFAPLAARLDSTAVESLVVHGLGGDDTIVGGNGISTLTRAHDRRRRRRRHPPRRRRRRHALGGNGNDHVDGNLGADTALLGGAGDDTLPVGSRRRQRHRRGPGRQRHSSTSTARNIGEQIELSANGRPRPAHPQRRRDHDGLRRRSRASPSGRSAAPTRSPSTTSPAPTSRPSTST